MILSILFFLALFLLIAGFILIVIPTPVTTPFGIIGVILGALLLVFWGFGIVQYLLTNIWFYVIFALVFISLIFKPTRAVWKMLGKVIGL